MKRIIQTLAALSVVAAATAAFAGNQYIKDTKHNLGSTGTGTYKATDTTGTGQICVYCHTPHNAAQNVPLWNRNNPTASNFTLYSSVTMKNTPIKTGFTSDSISLFCMSCHDGSALGSTAMIKNGPADGSAVTTPAAIPNTKDSYLGTDLKNDHPVNFNITVTGSANGLGDVAANRMKTTDVTNGFPLFNSGRGNQSLECGSCHSVHDDTNTPFLRTTNTGSKLCLGCHYK